MACSVCASCKTSNRPPGGSPPTAVCSFETLVAHRISFRLRLTSISGVQLVQLDQFSKAAHFIPLPKLPSARETAVTVIDQVFRIHGLPTDVVSDRGPQFVSKFCKCQSFLWFSSAEQRPNRAGQSRFGMGVTMFGVTELIDTKRNHF